MFGAVKLNKNADPDKYGCSGYCIWFDTRSNFSISGEWDKNVSIFGGGDNSLSAHTDYRKKDVLVLGEEPTDGLDNTVITGDAKHSVDITKSRRKLSESTLQCSWQFFVR